MKSIKKIIFPLLFLTLSPFPVYAVQIHELYEAKIQVKDQSETTRRDAIQTALKTVLIKIAGNSKIIYRPKTISLLKSAQHYLQAYRYEHIQTTKNPKTDANLLLWVKFSEDLLDRDLRAQGFGIWDHERPALLLWLVIQDKTGGHIVNAQTQRLNVIYNIVEQQITDRGVKLISPLLDIEDLNQLNSDDLINHAKQPLSQASKRYTPDVVLNGHLFKVADIWQSRWTLFTQNEIYTWQFRSHHLKPLLINSVHHLIDKLAQQFVSPFSENGLTRFSMVVENINDYKSYITTLQYLTSLRTIKTASPKRLTENHAIFILTSYSKPHLLASTIQLGDVLTPINQDGLEYQFSKK